MRILFAAYCTINDQSGESLVGVYKRALRLAMKMVERGHEVWMFCPGRQDYQGDLALQAETCVHFLDFPQRFLFAPDRETQRRCYRMALRRLQPDLVVLGEAPLDGMLLDASACATEASIRQVVLDNAYSHGTARAFAQKHRPLLDGIVLTGPSSMQMRRPPEYYCAAPPFIEGSVEEGAALLARSGFRPRLWVTVLGYEKRAQRLAENLLPRIMEHDCGIIWFTSVPRESQKSLATFAPQVAARTLFVLPPSDNLLFGLLQHSNLVIGNSEFTQVSECLALGTPFLGPTYPGCLPISLLPRRIRRFIHVTDKDHIDTGLVKAAVRLLYSSRNEMTEIHDGSFGGTSLVADFLEDLPAGRKRTQDGMQKRGWINKAIQVFSIGTRRGDNSGYRNPN